ncbi:hypothetical protein [Acinetobacter baumannii]|uniref:Uncharacterized protein n=1 Tax=Acinetobacter baumannii 21072 TaxID=1310697 RepID=A0A062IKA0_ACIBA|nr:hypothetical protein [Acinetobacter baumannii]KCY21629.1 hypothetical protein J596_0656 [Acinetobacter baumannii 21072]MDA3519539.1 hypothetical protein [Acinetobacter baumannii]MDC5251208.1 hypothetical protein [Acinetobacter baumannii]
MTTYIERLQDPKTVQKLENLLGGHVMSVYQNAGFTPPIPRLHGDRFIYPDPAAQRYANHLREGMKIFAQALDELNITQSTGEKANE